MANGHQGYAGQKGTITSAWPLILWRSDAISLNSGNMRGQGGTTTLKQGWGGSSKMLRRL
jgi:hypothetical protein